MFERASYLYLLLFLAQRLLDRVNDPLEVGVIGVWLGGIIGQVPLFIPEKPGHQFAVRGVQVINRWRFAKVFGFGDQLTRFLLSEFTAPAFFQHGDLCFVCKRFTTEPPWAHRLA
ncbi:hypothetical protein [Pseudomonas poae]|uniref:hypothetical protein n=1 Tax=Pseudomonas poae TaxID=200451 RepID=UPI000BF9D01B|nr:hypothetical protein [Pseudomonas poae]